MNQKVLWSSRREEDGNVDGERRTGVWIYGDALRARFLDG